MKKKVALVTGGFSGEAVVSYKSAKNIESLIDKEKFDVHVIDICDEGWMYTEGEERKQVDKNDFSIQLNGEKINFDAALMCIHGAPGEDGKLPGYFDLIGLPYTSCDAAIGAITFNKRFTVALASINGITVANSVLVIKGTDYHFDKIKNLNFPVFVKPNNGGSSVATSKVVKYDEALLKEAIDKAFEADKQVLVEEFIKGRELTVGVYKLHGETVVLPMSEVVMNTNADHEFFDFEAKYSGKTTEITPADVDDEIKSKINSAAEILYDSLNCKGIVRIDFIYDTDKKIPYMLEINTIPGQTDASFIPQQMRAAGKDLGAVYTEFLNEAIVSKK